MGAREVAVEHEDVVAHDPRLAQRIGAVGRDVDRHPLAPQAARDEVRQPWLVLCDQDAHGCEDDARRVRTRVSARESGR